MKDKLINFSQRLDAINFSTIDTSYIVNAISNSGLFKDKPKDFKDQLSKGIKIKDAKVTSEFEKLLQSYMKAEEIHEIPIIVDGVKLLVSNDTTGLILINEDPDVKVANNVLNRSLAISAYDKR